MAEELTELEKLTGRGCGCRAQLQVGICYVFMVALNGLAVALFQRGATDGYAFSYLQPDGSTFSIWGIIYTLLILLIATADRFHEEARTKLCGAFLMNGLWLITNGLAVNEGWSFWAAVFVLITYAALLWNVYLIMYINYCDGNILDRLSIYAPVSLNLSWVTLAAILNFTNTAMNDKLDFTKRENTTAIGGPDWAMGVCLLASLIAGYLALIRSDFVYALGTVWALQGVRRQQTQGSEFPHPISDKVHDWSNILSVVVGLAAIIALIRIIVMHPFFSKIFRTQRQRVSSATDPVIQELKDRFVPLKESKS